MFDRELSKRVGRAFVCAFGIATVAILCAGTASAQTLSKKTTVTFNMPVEIPGVGAQVLPAGVYVFRLMDSLSDRNIVQVFNKDESHIYATILAIPNFRLRATDKTVITFAERAAGEPQAIKAWFYPGDNWGQEFVYPKSKAMELAKTTNTPVLFTSTELPVEVAEPEKLADAPVVAEMKRTPILAVKPTGEEVQLAEVVTTPPALTQLAMASSASSDAPAAPARKRLPATASTEPLFALLGMMTLGAAAATRAIAKRIA